MKRAESELVMVGTPAEVRRAESLLASRGIEGRRSRAKTSEASLRVPVEEASSARAILRGMTLSDARVVEASEAAWFRCPECGHALTEGERYCARCNSFVG